MIQIQAPDHLIIVDYQVHICMKKPPRPIKKEVWRSGWWAAEQGLADFDPSS